MIPCPPLVGPNATADASQPALEKCPFCEEIHPEHILKCTNTDMPLPLAGRLLSSKFRFIRSLGKGGMASVWLALNTAVDREVAIKLIRPEVLKSEELVARFRSEAKAAGRIAHPNICDILDFGVGPVGPYIIMEYLRGKNLAEAIRASGYLEAPRAVELVLEALEGLEAAHACGIVHRDLKPENVFLHEPVAGAPIVKLMDFGVAKFTDGSAEITTAHGALLGTPEYMAPEQFKGADLAEPRTDVWAVGAILYRTLTGKHAFKGPTVAATLLMVTHEEPAPVTSLRPAVPEALEAVINRCLSKRIEDRYDTVEALRTAIYEAMDAPPTSTDHTPSVSADPLPSGDGLPDPFAALGTHDDAADPDPVADPDHLASTNASHSDLAKTAAYARARRLPFGARSTLLAAALLAVLAVLAMRFWPTDTSPEPTHAAAALEVTPAAESQTPPEPDTPPTTEAEAPPETSLIPPPKPDVPPVEIDIEILAEAEATPPSLDVPPPPPLTDDTTASADPPRTPAPDRDATPKEVPPEVTDLGGGYVLAKRRGKRVNHGDARKFCEALGVTEYGGIRSWKLPFPGLVKRIQDSGEIRSGKFWTSARWRGNVTTFTLPSGQLRKGTNAERRSARPLCIAPFVGLGDAP